MITIDDTCLGNLKMAEMIVKHGLEEETIFFADFNCARASGIIKGLSDMGFGIGSHTVNHKKVTEINDADLQTELKSSKEMIEKITNKKCLWFAYPYGDFDDRCIDALKKVGYKYARTCRPEDDGDYKLGCFELNGKKWEEAKKKKYKIYQMHYYNLERNNSFSEFDEFLNWYKK